MENKGMIVVAVVLTLLVVCVVSLVTWWAISVLSTVWGVYGK